MPDQTSQDVKPILKIPIVKVYRQKQKHFHLVIISSRLLCLIPDGNIIHIPRENLFIRFRLHILCPHLREDFTEQLQERV